MPAIRRRVFKLSTDAPVSVCDVSRRQRLHVWRGHRQFRRAEHQPERSNSFVLPLASCIPGVRVSARITMKNGLPFLDTCSIYAGEQGPHVLSQQYQQYEGQFDAQSVRCTGGHEMSRLFIRRERRPSRRRGVLRTWSGLAGLVFRGFATAPSPASHHLSVDATTPGVTRPRPGRRSPPIPGRVERQSRWRPPTRPDRIRYDTVRPTFHGRQRSEDKWWTGATSTESHRVRGGSSHLRTPKSAGVVKWPPPTQRGVEPGGGAVPRTDASRFFEVARLVATHLPPTAPGRIRWPTPSPARRRCISKHRSFRSRRSERRSNSLRLLDHAGASSVALFQSPPVHPAHVEDRAQGVDVGVDVVQKREFHAVPPSVSNSRMDSNNRPKRSSAAGSIQ
jgi:hypothetical protein